LTNTLVIAQCTKGLLTQQHVVDSAVAGELLN